MAILVRKWTAIDVRAHALVHDEVLGGVLDEGVRDVGTHGEAREAVQEGDEHACEDRWLRNKVKVSHLIGPLLLAPICGCWCWCKRICHNRFGADVRRLYSRHGPRTALLKVLLPQR